MDHTVTHIQQSKLFNVQRLEAFTDGVLAIVATLLILNLEPPKNVGLSDLPIALFSMWPHYISYILSFYIVGMFWYIHHILMKLITKVDEIALLINLLFLMIIAFIPFPTELMSEYNHDIITIIIFGGIQIVNGILIIFLWLYCAYCKNYVSDNIQPHVISKITIAVVVPPLINSLAILNANINCYVSLIFFLIAPLFYVYLSNEYLLSHHKINRM